MLNRRKNMSGFIRWKNLSCCVKTMSRMEERLDPESFARIHRSSIVNIEHIKEIQPWSHGDYVVGPSKR